MPMRCTFPGGCGSAANGTASRPLATLPMNVRRSITEITASILVSPAILRHRTGFTLPTDGLLLADKNRAMTAMERNALRLLLAGQRPSPDRRGPTLSGHSPYSKADRL